ncbi:MAG: hypothetical protein MMC33_004570 [Icmadophila ericetorum]|nr:hypothetical protein [Icmadophila ericetorum]
MSEEMEGVQGNFDEVVRFLSDKIVLAAENGLTVFEVAGLIKEFYSSAETSNAETINNENATVPIVEKVDRRLQEQIWSWLTRHPGVQIGKHSEGRELGLGEAELYDARNASSISPKSTDDGASSEEFNDHKISSGVEVLLADLHTSAGGASTQGSLPKQAVRIYILKEPLLQGPAMRGLRTDQNLGLDPEYLPSLVKTSGPMPASDITAGPDHGSALVQTPMRDTDDTDLDKERTVIQKQLTADLNDLKLLGRAGARFEEDALIYKPSMASHSSTSKLLSAPVAKKKRGRPRKVQVTTDALQNTTPPSANLRPGNLQERPVKRGRPKIIRPYFPSMTAHSIPFTRLTKDLKEQLTPQLQLLREIDRIPSSISSHALQLAEKSQRTRKKTQKFLEAEEADLQSDPLVTKKQFKQPKQWIKSKKITELEKSVISEQPEKLIELEAPNNDSNPDHHTEAPSRHLKSYTEQEDKIGNREVAGVYVGAQGKLSIGIGRPRMTRLAIFKSPRLTELTWFKKEEPRELRTFTTPRSAAQKRQTLVREGLIEPERGFELISGDEPAMPYEQQGSQTKRISSGAYVGPPASIYREFNGGFHRFKSRLLIVNSSRLSELEFFIEKPRVAKPVSHLAETVIQLPENVEEITKVDKNSSSSATNVERIVDKNMPPRQSLYTKMTMQPLEPSSSKSSSKKSQEPKNAKEPKKAKESRKTKESKIPSNHTQISSALANQSQTPLTAASAPPHSSSVQPVGRPPLPGTTLGLPPTVYKSPYADTSTTEHPPSTPLVPAPFVPTGHRPFTPPASTPFISAAYTQYSPTRYNHFVPPGYAPFAPPGHMPFALGYPSFPPGYMAYAPPGYRAPGIPDLRSGYPRMPSAYVPPGYQPPNFTFPTYQQPVYPPSGLAEPQFRDQGHNQKANHAPSKRRKKPPMKENSRQPPQKRVSTSSEIDLSIPVLGHEETRMLQASSRYEDVLAIDRTQATPETVEAGSASPEIGSNSRLSSVNHIQSPREVFEGQIGRVISPRIKNNVCDVQKEPQALGIDGTEIGPSTSTGSISVSDSPPDRITDTVVVANPSSLPQEVRNQPAQEVAHQPVIISTTELNQSPERQENFATDFSTQENISDHVNIDENRVEANATPSDPSVPVPSLPTEKAPAAKLSLKGGSAALAKRQMVLEIVEKCGGVYPADNELWYAFTTRWLAQDDGMSKDNGKSKDGDQSIDGDKTKDDNEGKDGETSKNGGKGKPDSRIVNSIRKALTDSGKLRRVTFSYENKRGVTVTKSIVTLVDIPPHDSKVEDLVKKIKDCDAQYYFPPEVEIREGLKLGKDTVAPRPVPVPVSESMNSQSPSPPPPSTTPNGSKRGPSRSKKTANENSQLRRTATLRAARKRSSEVEEHGGHKETQSQGNLGGPKRRRSGGIRKTVISSRRLNQETPGGQFGILKLTPSNTTKNRSGLVQRLSNLKRSTATAKSSRTNTVLGNGTLDPRLLADTEESLDEAAQQLHREAALEQDLRDEEEELREQQAFEEYQALFTKRNRRGEKARHQRQSVSEKLQSGRFRRNGPESTLRVKFVNPLDPESDSEFEPDVQISDKGTFRTLRNLAPPQQTTTVMNRSPATYDSYWWKQIFTLTDPDQMFHPSTGTFSTNYSAWRDTRLYLRVAPDPKNIPDSNKKRRLRLARASNVDDVFAELIATDYTRGLGPEDIFRKEVDAFEKWETHYAPQDAGQQEGWKFVNHHFPGPQVVASNTNPIIRFDDDEDDDDFEPEEEPEEPEEPEEVSEYDIPRPVLGKRKRKSPQKRVRRLNQIQEKLTKPSIPGGLETSLAQGIDPNQIQEIKLRGPRNASTLDGELDKRIMYAVIVTRILTGGMERNIDWRLLAKIFKGQYTERSINKKWSAMLQKYNMLMNTFYEDFQDMYIEACEKEEVPIIDYDNIEDFDWNTLINWTVENIDSSRERVPDLPPARSILDTDYILRDEWNVRDVSGLYEMRNPKSMTKRREIIARDPFFIPLRSEVHQKPPTDVEIAQSWIKSNVITSDATYDKQAVADRLSKLPDETVDNALQALLNTKVISQTNKGRLVPSRNFDISVSFLNGLQKHLSVQILQEAASFKPSLDRRFSEQGSADFSYHAGDGVSLAVINMLSNHRIIFTPKNPPMSEYGLLAPGKYQTRFIDWDVLVFTVSMTTSPTYIYGNPLLPLPTPPMCHPLDAHNPEMARSPVWYNVNYQLEPVMWKLVIAAVLSIITMRPGLSPREMCKALAEKLEVWEVEMVYAWFIEAGVARYVGGGEKGRVGETRGELDGDLQRGITLGEWWWLCFGEVEGEGT